MPVLLRDYQNEAIAALHASEQRGVRRNAIVLPTGSGKTVVFGSITANTKGRTLILAHRDELIQQAVDKLLQIEPNLNIGVVKAEQNQIGAKVVVGSVQTLAREPRRKRLFAGAPFERVIVDELHHVVAKSYREVLEAAGCFRDDGPLLLGVTATPNRGDGVGLSAVIQEIVYERDVKWGIEAGYLCDLRGKQIELAVDFDSVKTTGGDFQDGDLGEAMEAANAPEVIANAYQEYAAGLMTIVFVPTIRMADQTAQALRHIGVKAEMINGQMPLDERRAVLSRFHHGITKVVTNAAVLLEGFDEPGVSCIIIGRPTKSGALFRQMVGRGTRRHPGKQDCLIIDCVGAANRNKLIGVNSLFGLPLDALQDGKKSVKQVLQEIQEAEERRHPGKFRARDVDLFGQASFHWVSGPNGWILPGGGGTQYLITSDDPAKDSWKLVASRMGQHGREQQTLMENTTLGLAQGSAEDAVRQSGTIVFAQKGARWRSDPASAKQIELLIKFGLPAPEGITKGAASDAIDVAMAARSGPRR